jgi:hypothetical protein
VYLDVGAAEGDGTLADARALRDILVGAGYAERGELRYLEDGSGEHHEADWGRRFGEAVPFLIGAGELGSSGAGETAIPPGPPAP